MENSVARTRIHYIYPASLHKNNYILGLILHNFYCCVKIVIKCFHEAPFETQLSWFSVHRLIADRVLNLRSLSSKFSSKGTESLPNDLFSRSIRKTDKKFENSGIKSWNSSIRTGIQKTLKFTSFISMIPTSLITVQHGGTRRGKTLQNLRWKNSLIYWIEEILFILQEWPSTFRRTLMSWLQMPHEGQEEAICFTWLY